MKQLLLKISKMALIVILCLLTVLLVIGLVLMLGWPWWVGGFAILALVGIFIGLVMLRKMMLRRRERLFVHQVIAQDESMRNQMAAKDQDGARQLQLRWKEAVDALRRSHLRKHGNPLYVLPWYMVIGESGSGKTTAIESARLSSPFGDISRTSGISGTRNCDWWFFEQAILIDTAGRYALPVDKGQDRDEWQKFLSLLARFRRKEPLNGLVVTIAADKLAQAAAETIDEDGRKIRRRIDELMRVLGARFPVYVMVTKCDLVQGATQFCDHLSEEALGQAMGSMNQNLETDGQSLVDTAFKTVGDRLRDMRLLIMHQKKETASDPALLVFPEEFSKLQDNLKRFVASAFQDNPYQESPLLRGIYFSSGRQEGTPYSHFLNALGLIQSREVLPGTNRGLFLHDFFSTILPRDRHLFQPTQHTMQWSRLTRNLGMTAWVAIALALCGLLSFSFVKNLKSLRDVSQAFSKPAILQGDLLTDVMTMERFRQAVARVEQQNSHWWIPRFGLNESSQVERQLKDRYTKLFENGFLKDFDRQMGEQMTRYSAGTSPAVIGAHVMHLVQRIHLLRKRLEGNPLDQLLSYPQPDYGQVLAGRGQALIPEVRNKIGGLYVYALSWQQQTEALNDQLTHLQTWLKHLLTLKGVSLNWLADWANEDATLSGTNISDYWGTHRTDQFPAVAPAFSVAGKNKIDTALADIETALFDPLIVAGPKLTFAKWYRNAYLEAWRRFVIAFPQGWKTLAGRDEWQPVMGRMASDKGPMLALINTLADQLEPFSESKALPVWAQHVYDFKEAQKASAAAQMKDGEKPGLLTKATKKVKSKLKKAERAVGIKAGTAMDLETRIETGRAYLAMMQALGELAKAADSQAVAFQMATDIYSQDPATGKSPFFSLEKAQHRLKTLIRSGAKEKSSPFWHLLTANRTFIHRYINQEAACQLQRQWEKKVLLEVQEVTAEKNMAQLLMGKGGYAANFVSGPAAPFINRSLSKGYYAKTVLGQSVPFDDSFFKFLVRGAKAAKPVKGSYKVNIRAYPTDANRGANVRPHATILDLQCSSGSIRLENLNYPVGKTFTWSPQSCGDVVFQIMVGNVILTKNYTGYNAFAKFLKEFKTGQRVFYRKEFPAEEPSLKRMGINYIKAKYRFQGHRQVIRLLERAPGRIPNKIVACWGR